ncbi:MAG: GlxA family transcriptional regulator [Cohaesibacter sp.]|nr:GlxA family transcriptional regulator [Cohaesibacter sp.]
MTHFSFLLFDQFSNLCLANAIEPLRAANMKAGKMLYDWSLISPDGEPVFSSSTMEIKAGHALGDLADAPQGSALVPDILFTMPSYHYRSHGQPDILAQLRKLAKRGVTLGGLDCGSHMLAKAGLLDGYRATIHWEEVGLFEERFLDVEVTTDRFVIDRNRITAGGGTTTLDLMLELIRRDHGESLANEVAGVFVYDHERPPSDAQWMTPAGILARRNPAIAKVLTLMIDTLEAPLPMGEIASRTGMSQRGLERLFQAVLSTTPRKYYQHLRLSKARSLLMESRLTVEEIAVRSGYRTAIAFTRAFKGEFGIQPSRLRKMR